jgi:N-acetylmuramoyl-L-alanine amidase
MRALPLLFCCLLAGMLCLPGRAQFSGRKIVVDAGHGGTDPGAVGIDGGSYPNEEDFVLDVAQRFAALLTTAGAEVILTRDADETVSLTTRRDLTNAEDPDLFLSIHCNSFSDSSAHGTETFWWTSGTTADQDLATDVQNRMMQKFSLTNRGVKQANFTVITANPPAALAEMMFISNQAEFDLMNTTATRAAAAQAFYEAAADFLGIDLTAPQITAQPASLTKNPGETAVISAVVSGSNHTYQWRKNGAAIASGGRISGATTPTLTISNFQLSDAGFYTLAVTHAGAVLVSDAAQLVLFTPPFPAGVGGGLRGTFYDNMDFTALRRARIDATVNFDWAAGAPSSTMQPETFSARWTGEVEPRYSQTYTFHTTTDDGVRLWVNNVLLIDKWQDQGATEWSGSIALTAGVKAPIRMDYFENGGAASARLEWSSASQMREVIPTSQLHRPPPSLAAPPNATMLAGSSYQVQVAAVAFDPLLSSQPFADFETYADGVSDAVMFRRPALSPTTSAFLDAARPLTTAVAAGFPSGNSSSRVVRAEWSFLSGSANPWLRLTTAGAANLPHPTIDFRKALRFDAYSEKPLKIGLGLRETNTAAAIGADGGSTGPIEFTGVPSLLGSSPNPERILTAGTWTTLQFDLADEPLAAFTGNGVLESSTGLGVLEHLCLAPAAPADLSHVLYLDNFVVVEPNFLTYSLVSGPAGAGVDPVTGRFSWLAPTGFSGPVNVAVRATDAGNPPRSAETVFTLLVAPPPEIQSAARSASAFTLTWKSAAGAQYEIQAADRPSGQWQTQATVSGTGPVTTQALSATAARRFYRVRLKLP